MRQEDASFPVRFMLDPVADAVINDTTGRVIPITRVEFRVLHRLMTHAYQILTYQDLIDTLWGYGPAKPQNSIRVTIYRLRRKIEIDARQPRHIITVRGHGYMFRY
jgi:DNA-binding response OmpR family regulator